MVKRHWTKEELDYLESVWGVMSLPAICKNLNRSENSVKLKAYRVGLGDPIKSFDGISTSELSKVININYNILLNWEIKYGFPVKYKRFTNEKKIRVIRYEDWWNWLEQNKQMVDFSRFDKGDLGPEPSWVEVKRKADQRLKILKPRSHSTAWSDDEVSRLKFFVEKGLTYPEICDQLKRSHGAVKRKLNELKIKFRPTYLDNHTPYKPAEVEYILEGLDKGISFEEMARHLKRSEAGVRGKLERMGYKFKNGVPYKAS